MMHLQAYNNAKAQRQHAEWESFFEKHEQPLAQLPEVNSVAGWSATPAAQEGRPGAAPPPPAAAVALQFSVSNRIESV